MMRYAEVDSPILISHTLTSSFNTIQFGTASQQSYQLWAGRQVQFMARAHSASYPTDTEDKTPEE